MKPKYITFFSVLLVIIIGDIYTKSLIVEHIAYRDGFSVWDGFLNIVHAHNRGAAFGLFNDGNPSWVMPFFLITGIIALGFLLSLVRKLPDHRRFLPGLLGGIAGGAVGNMTDRIRWGYVVDFLDFYVGNNHWPAFNVADMGISMGVTALLIMSLLQKDDELFSGPPKSIDDDAA